MVSGVSLAYVGQATHVGLQRSRDGDTAIFLLVVLHHRDRLQTAARDGGWPEIAVPRRIIQVDALPLLGTGKIDYVTLKQMAEKA